MDFAYRGALYVLLGVVVVRWFWLRLAAVLLALSGAMYLFASVRGEEGRTHSVFSSIEL
jgi:hypothetical protein